MEQIDPNAMARALEAARSARLVAPPNPWVGCVVACADGREFTGSTEAPGSRHAERVALDAAAQAGADLRGATVYVTLEPCSHHGRTAPCVDALIDAGVTTVVVALVDPDQRVSGAGIERLRQAGITVEVGPGAEEAARQLEPYLHHRRTGRPFVVLKLAATLDGRTAAPDGTSRWITSAPARVRVHQLRAESGAVVVGASTVRADDPELTVRHVEAPSPRRVVLGKAPEGAKVHPCTEWQGDLGDLLDRLGGEGVLQVLVEGGAKVAASFHRARLVDRYVIHLAPALMGGDDGMSMLSGLGASTMAELWRGRIDALRMLGDDIEIELIPQETA
ncbi:MAG: bifunctional diaminohydroxyphosphoribosylaminopyrimidine [Actinomycetota bacterium]|jgi:diaminohydroxyphosphoribosylaminopyrimidine deaminase/5-amino-6-(5-phosphoribosylamino)uracil reductase